MKDTMPRHMPGNHLSLAARTAIEAFSDAFPCDRELMNKFCKGCDCDVIHPPVMNYGGVGYPAEDACPCNRIPSDMDCARLEQFEAIIAELEDALLDVQDMI